MEVDLNTLSEPIEVEASVVDTPIEQPETELPEPEVPESPDPEPEKEDAPDEVKEDAEVVTEDAPAEPVTFDAAAPDFTEKVAETLDKYELPQEVSAVIEALQSKVSENGLAEFAEYAPPDAAPEVVASTVKTLLDRVAYLDTVTVEESGVIRPNTDKFADEIHKAAPDKASWLYFDFAKLPSEKYPNLNKFEEGIADALAKEGDTVQTVITRYHQTMTAVKNGVEITSDAPSFIPAELRDAYWSLSKREREELDSFDPSFDRIEYDDDGRAVNQDEAIRYEKLVTLAKIQKGIEGDRYQAQTQAQQQAQKVQEFHQEVQANQEKFYTAFRDSVTQDVRKNVKFSDNPKMQAILAHQNVALLGDALMPGAIGDSARSVLAEAGIKFDLAKANKLQNDIEVASAVLAQSKQIKDANGKVVNEIEFNKATAQYRKVTAEFQAFAKDILDQEARLVSTGTAEAVKAEVAKIKVAPKARAATTGVGTPAKQPKQNPYQYGTQDYYAFQADELIRAKEAQKARAYA